MAAVIFAQDVASGPAIFAADYGNNRPSKPQIVSRKEWNAKAPVGKAAKNRPRYITIHHTATLQKPAVPIAQKMRALQDFSQREDRLDTGKFKPVWFDVPYHFYIAADGQIAEGRKLKYVGDTNTEYDPTGHALIVLEGSFNKEQPTAPQLESLRQLTVWLARRYKIPPEAIKGHGDYAKTACPGENLKKLLPDLRKSVQ
jgi:N-acetyl-anhydromuramyl-L-alanine amidase AmpD